MSCTKKMRRTQEANGDKNSLCHINIDFSRHENLRLADTTVWLLRFPLKANLIEVAALLTPPCMVVILPQGLPGIFCFSTHFFVAPCWSSSCLCGWLRPTVKGSGATS